MRYHLLDPLRGLAALWVFGFHYQFSDAFQTSFPYVHQVLKLGNLGVAMFFVVSGYCVTAAAKNCIARETGVGGFLYRRSTRIYPTFWCSILVVAGIPFAIELISVLRTGNYVPPSAENPNLGFLDYGLGDWLRVLTLTQVFSLESSLPGMRGLQGKFTSINAVYWTLAIEFQFYLAIALALAIRQRFYVVLVAVTVAALPFFLTPASYSVGIFLPYWPMFALGIALYWCQESGYTPRCVGTLAPLGSALAVVALLTGFLAYVASGHQVGKFAFAVLLFATLWVAFPLDEHFRRAVTSRNILVRLPLRLLLVLGAMSYSIYLLHGRVHFLAAQFIRQVLPTNSLAYDVAVLVGTCVMIYPFFRCCEAPFQSSGPRLRRESPLVSRPDVSIV